MSTNYSACNWLIFNLVADSRLVWSLPNYNSHVKWSYFCRMGITDLESRAVVAVVQALLT